jgi:hypothetical protein
MPKRVQNETEKYIKWWQELIGLKDYEKIKESARDK